MSKWMLAAGAAVIALATPTLADPGGNKGNKDGQAKAMKADRGDRGGNEKQARGERRGGGEMRVAQRDDRGNGNNKARGGDDDDDRKARVRGNNRDDDDDRRVDRIRGNDRVVIRDRDDDDDRRIRFGDRDGRRFVRFDDDDDRRRGLINGCPPGLAKKDNGCLPPGQAKKLIGNSLPLALRASMLDGPYRQWYRDDDRFTYRRDDDYIYRVRRDGGLIDALIPYGSRDYSYYPVGMSYPLDYNSYNVPYQYRSFYPDGGDYLYRYGNNAIYQVDPQTNMIQSIVALLAGDLGVGQRMPSNYGVYNVPLAYRDRYYDTPDAMYRYNDGYIYQADPTTQLITAVISALV